MNKVIVGYKQYDDRKWYISSTSFVGSEIQEFTEKDSYSNENDAIDRLDAVIEEYEKKGYVVEIRK